MRVGTFAQCGVLVSATSEMVAGSGMKGRNLRIYIKARVRQTYLANSTQREYAVRVRSAGSSIFHLHHQQLEDIRHVHLSLHWQ